MSESPSLRTGTDDSSTVTHAASVFEARLFPEGENQGEPKPGSEPAPKPTETAATPAEGEAEPVEGAEPEPKPTPRSRKLKLGDEEVDVTEDEAYLGYLRTADYTRKTQALAEIRKQAEQEAQQARDQRAAYMAELEQLKRGMDALVPSEPDWAAMRAKGVSDAEIAAAAETYQQFKSQREAVEARQKKLLDDQLADERKVMVRREEEEREKLYVAIPEWRDPSVDVRERGKLVQWLAGKGWSKDQVESIVDHQLVVALYHSMLYDEGQAKAPTGAARRAARTAAPGAPTPPKQPINENDRARAALAKSGKIRDAARVFEGFLPD